MFQAQMGNIFGGEMAGEIPMFFLREKKTDIMAISHSESIAELRLRGQNFYLPGFFKVILVTMPQSSFSDCLL